MGKHINVLDFVNISLEASPPCRKPPRPDRVVGHLGQLGWCTLQMSAGGRLRCRIDPACFPSHGPPSLPRRGRRREGRRSDWGRQGRRWGERRDEGERERGARPPPFPCDLCRWLLVRDLTFSCWSVAVGKVVVVFICCCWPFCLIVAVLGGGLWTSLSTNIRIGDYGHTIYSLLNGYYK